ncbi:MAG: hypothetical protein IT349_00230 [Candidatus Eisenbacteria bacterium]|nr:hypothetical protein [Candidatus Eisenbacteria bacterium]
MFRSLRVASRPETSWPGAGLWGAALVGLLWLGCSSDDATQNPPPPGDNGVHFRTDRTTISEMTRTVRLVLDRDGDLADTTDVLLRLVEGTALDTVDFSAFPGGTRKVAMGVSDESDTAFVSAVPDSTVEADETFTATIESTTNGAKIGEPSTITITLIDLAADFSLPDVNTASPSHNLLISPRNKQQKLTAWYFGHAT